MSDVRPIVRFAGSKSQGLAAARALVEAATTWQVQLVTIDDRADERSVFAGFEALSRESAVPLTVVRSRAEARTVLCQPADILVVVGWYWLLSTEERSATRLGAVGVHNSLLPRFRGGAPLSWAIMCGESLVGATLFSLGDGMDDGDIWAQITVPVGNDETIGDVLQRLEPAATEMLVQQLPGMLDGTHASRPQDHAQASYAAQRIPDDGVIDWNRPVRQVHDFVRAMATPYPGAFTYWRGQRLHVWRTTIAVDRWHATPGQAVSIRDGGVHVACGDGGVLVLHEVGYQGRRGIAADVIRSRDARFPRVPLLLDRLTGAVE